jgi:hypothetical protein
MQIGIRGAMSDENPLYGYALLLGPAIVAWQAYSWLRTGIWTPIPASRMFNYFGWPIPHTSWLGLQSIIDWLFNIPASLVVFLTSFLFIVVCFVSVALFQNYQANRKST